MTDLDLRLKKQVSAIKDVANIMIKNAEYGNQQNFNQNIKKIRDAAVTIGQELDKGVVISAEKKYGRILVPYDDSKYSKKALAEAIDVAQEAGSEIYIVNVIGLMSSEPDIVKDLVNKKLKKLERDTIKSQKIRTNKILQEKLKVCKRYGIKVRCDVLVGKPVDSILKYAKDNGIELVIIGSKGLGRFNKLMALGSVSRRISEEAKCPVMIVR
ncbi:MAG TPA: universal stress protein [Candidatus Nitrosotalea sp.]|nr:universal stress protein [Candidatus Nitrosotalea sp.]